MILMIKKKVLIEHQKKTIVVFVIIH